MTDRDLFAALKATTAEQMAGRMSDDAMRHQLEQTQRRLKQLAPKNLIAHAAYVHRTDVGKPMVPARHHAEWLRVLQDRERYPFVCIVAPPGFSKSTYASWVYPTWRLGESEGKVRLGLISNTMTQAHGFAQAVWSSVQTPMFRRAYPDVRLDASRGAGKGMFYVTGAPDGPNPSVLASGIGGPVLGKRFDEIIVDDPLTWADARSEVTMRGVRHWLKTTLITRLPPGCRPPNGKGRIVVICTRWSQTDLIPTLQDLGFEIITMPALGYWDRSARCTDCGWERPDFEMATTSHLEHCPHCGTDALPELTWGNEALWPEVEDQDYLLRERAEDELIFELVKQGNPKVLSGDTFDADWFQRAPMPRLEEFDSIVQGVDTAGGKDRLKGDFFAHVTIGNKGAEEWILYVYVERIPAPQQEKKIVELYDMFRLAGKAPDLVTIEDANEGRAVYQHLEQESRLPLDLTAPVGDKDFRAIPLSNAYRARRVWHAETDVHGKASKWLMKFEAQCESFPDGAHDDMVDAATGAYAKLRESSPRLRVL